MHDYESIRLYLQKLKVLLALLHFSRLIRVRRIFGRLNEAKVGSLAFASSKRPNMRLTRFKCDKCKSASNTNKPIFLEK